MRIQMFRSSPRAIFKRLMGLLVSVILLVGLSQTVVLASSAHAAIDSDAASILDEPIPEANLDRMRQQRRQWQSEASAAAYDATDVSGEPIGEAVSDKLNLGEITQENELLKDAREVLQGDSSNTAQRR